MPHLRPLSPRTRLLIVTLLAAILALAAILYDASREQERQLIRAQDDAMQFAQFASAVLDYEVQEARALLVALAHMSLSYRGDRAACSQFLAHLLAQYRCYANIGVMLPDGEVVCSAVPLKGKVNLGDRPWFQRVLETRAFSMGEYQMGRITGRPTLNFASPILDGSGRVEAVVGLVLDLDWYNRVAEKIQFPRGGTLTVIDYTGVVVVNSPDAAKWVGRSLLGRPIVRKALSERIGTSEIEGIDGATSLGAFMPLSGDKESTLYVIVTIPRDVVLAGVERYLIHNLTILVVVSGRVVLVVWGWGSSLVLSRAGVLVGVAKRVAAGDLSARSGLPSYGHGGLDQLARSVDEMAVALEQREAERNKAEQALQDSKSFVEAILDGMPDSVCVIDVSDFRILGANKSFLDANGRNIQDVVGKTCHEVTHGLSTPCIGPEDLCPIAEMLQTGGHSVEEHLHRRSDGTEYYTEVSASPIEWDPEGRIRKVVHVSRDITERKRAEQEREYFISKLQKAMAEVKTLRGIVPICASCKKIRDDGGYWQQVEVYVREHSEAQFSHGICPECYRTLYPEYVDEE